MEQLRHLRFALPPFFFFGSLILGAWINGLISYPPKHPLDGPTVALIVAIATAATLPLGFIFGAATVLILRGLTWLVSLIRRSSRYHEAWYSKEVWELFWDGLEVPKGQMRLENQLYADVVFTSETLDEKYTHWITRRWEAFNADCSSLLAVFVAALIGYWYFCFPVRSLWTAINVLLLLILALAAYVAWRETVGMKEFEARRKWER